MHSDHAEKGSGLHDFPLLYVIVTSALCSIAVEEAVEHALQGGADVIQLREKDLPDSELLSLADKVQRLCARYDKTFIVNDNIDVALACEANGVHLGQDDLPLAAARKIMGPRRIIGISTHSLSQALAAEKGGADYIGFGPLFSTRTKDAGTPLGPALLREAAERIKIPIFPIGGINETNIREIARAGVQRAAVCSSVLKAKDVSGMVKILKEGLQ